MAENGNVIENLLKGLDTSVSAKTVVGQPMTVDGVTIIPLVDVSFGMAAGSGNENGKSTKNKGMGGLGGKVSPNAILVIKDGNARILSIKNQDSITKILDMIPEVVNRISKAKNGGPEDDEIRDAAFPDEEKDK